MGPWPYTAELFFYETGWPSHYWVGSYVELYPKQKISKGNISFSLRVWGLYVAWKNSGQGKIWKRQPGSVSMTDGKVRNRNILHLFLPNLMGLWLILNDSYLNEHKSNSKSQLAYTNLCIQDRFSLLQFNYGELLLLLPHLWTKSSFIESGL